MIELKLNKLMLKEILINKFYFCYYIINNININIKLILKYLLLYYKGSPSISLKSLLLLIILLLILFLVFS
jgi:hypothetical protein